jgi:hypothetical protein
MITLNGLCLQETDLQSKTLLQFFASWKTRREKGVYDTIVYVLVNITNNCLSKDIVYVLVNITKIFV